MSASSSLLYLLVLALIKACSKLVSLHAKFSAKKRFLNFPVNPYKQKIKFIFLILNKIIQV